MHLPSAYAIISIRISHAFHLVLFPLEQATEYQTIVSGREHNLYGTEIIPLPTPKCVVFYNGKDNNEDYYEMHLSDAFINKDSSADAELTVHIYNINSGHNHNLMERCPTLDGYVHLVDKINRYKTSTSLRRAVQRAIDECIDEGYIEDFLKHHKSEVLDMVLFDTEKKKYERAIRDDGKKEGIRIGIVLAYHNKGMSIEEISKETMLTAKEIDEILQSNTDQFPIRK